MEMDRDALFNSAYQKWGDYLLNVARKMCSRRGITARVDEEDFEQIAMISLMEAIESFDGCPDDPSFGGHLTQVLKHDCLDELQFQSAGMRDYRKDVHESSIICVSGSGGDDILTPFFGTCQDTKILDPNASLEMRELVMKARAVLGPETIDPITGQPIPGSGSDEFYLFNEYVYTAMFGPHADIERVYQDYQEEKCWFLECPSCGYKRVVNYGYQPDGDTCPGYPMAYECSETLVLKGGRKHEKVPLIVYARGFGWARSHARRVMSNMRTKLIDKLHLDPKIFSGTA